MKKFVFLLLVPLLFFFFFYRLAGRGDALPTDVTKLYIALLENRTAEPFLVSHGIDLPGCDASPEPPEPPAGRQGRVVFWPEAVVEASEEETPAPSRRRARPPVSVNLVKTPKHCCGSPRFRTRPRSSPGRTTRSSPWTDRRHPGGNPLNRDSRTRPACPGHGSASKPDAPPGVRAPRSRSRRSEHVLPESTAT